jgi:endonuclease/exonuclease/phosphatase family metal-dependent hydrolase
MTPSPLRLLTYNIHKGFNSGNRRFVLKHIRDHLLEQDADILCLQEMQGEHTNLASRITDWPDRSQHEFLADKNWPHHAYAKNAVYNAGHHGNAVLSKYALIEWENINVADFSWASRSILHGVIHPPGYPSKVHIICIHFGLFGGERKRQIASLCQRIESHVPHHEPLIIAGDFNDWRGQAERLFHENLDLKEVFKTLKNQHARSFPSWLPVLPMDRIYYRGLNPIGCAKLNQKQWRDLSDHVPLTATFTYE